MVGDFCMPVAIAEPVRIKDLGKISGWRENTLTGYGLITGLAGTGDSVRNKATRQSIANMLSRFDLNIIVDDIQSKNVAAVMVTAVLPPFARVGDTLDVTITSVGDARSLVGGLLILAPLKAVDGKVYALAQGPVSVGGYKYDANGNVKQKNHPTVASIPSGAIVEVGILSEIASANNTVTFVLAEPDYTTATRVATAINAALGKNFAVAKDASGIEVQIPEGRKNRLADFVTTLENVKVQPDRRAKVVINERTGTIISGGDVRIAQVVVSHGELKVSIMSENSVSQPIIIGNAGNNVRSTAVTNTQIDVDEKNESGFVAPTNNTVADLVLALIKIKTNTRDIISILRGVKAAGALHADLIVQ